MNEAVPTPAPVPRKLSAAPAAELCMAFELTPEARSLLADADGAVTFFDRLVATEHWLDAIAFLARALPKREAVWWACMCARVTASAPPEAAAAASSGSDGTAVGSAGGRALAAAEAWVYKPTEENRRECEAAAHAAQFDSPESWAAIAAFWSGGSVAPPDGPVVPPGEDLTPRAVAGAVILSAVRHEPERADERYRLFLGKGRDIAAGGTGRGDTPIA